MYHVTIKKVDLIDSKPTSGLKAKSQITAKLAKAEKAPLGMSNCSMSLKLFFINSYKIFFTMQSLCQQTHKSCFFSVLKLL